MFPTYREITRILYSTNPENSFENLGNSKAEPAWRENCGSVWTTVARRQTPCQFCTYRINESRVPRSTTLGKRQLKPRHPVARRNVNIHLYTPLKISNPNAAAITSLRWFIVILDDISCVIWKQKYFRMRLTRFRLLRLTSFMREHSGFLGYIVLQMIES